ncbi:MAG: PD-(D/E)XK nuclease family protein, partial [Planctomycetota bacterium]
MSALPSPKILFGASAAEARLGRAVAWLTRQPADQPLLLVGTSLEALSTLVRRALTASGRPACLGWRRTTLMQLAAEVARPALVAGGAAVLSRLGAEALVAGRLDGLCLGGGLGRFAPLAQGPGLPQALTRTLEELRLHGVDEASLGGVAPDLGAILSSYTAALAAEGLLDRAGLLRLAIEQAPRVERPRLGVPLLLLDVAILSPLEQRFVRALVERASEACATWVPGDRRTRVALESAGFAPEPEALAAAAARSTALTRLQARLFRDVSESALVPAEDDPSVTILSAPGEVRECAELARHLLELAREGVPFDRIAIALHQPQRYRAPLEEALERAGIPAGFSRGTVRPDPAGRALIALLRCALEGLSARRFAEYLSLGEVPQVTQEGAPPKAIPAGARYVPPDEELLPDRLLQALPAALDLADEERGDLGAARSTEPERAAVTAGTLRAPRRWEGLMTDAAVIGGHERWRKRLSGLRREIEDAVRFEAEDSPRRSMLARRLADLTSLEAFALPLIGVLGELPSSAPWGTWLEAIGALCTRALREPWRTLQVLSELQPLAQRKSPVDLIEVLRVLTPRLTELSVRPKDRTSAGRVQVLPIERLRGLSFRVVIVPGLAERQFPRRIDQDPILPDAQRERLRVGDPTRLELPTRTERAQQERLALRIAVGAATERAILSYPRIDLVHARPQLPSFYLLECVRASEGELPSWDALSERAERSGGAATRWPAPRRPEDAIDTAEHDLALLRTLLPRGAKLTKGVCRFLLDANPHLARALRSRARRWLTGWTPADGLVNPCAAGAAALKKHGVRERSFSPTALEHLAQCPYRFYLRSIAKLQPREVKERIERMNPLQRGSLFHDIMFQLLTALREGGLLPLDEAKLPAAREVLDEVAGRLAATYKDELCPAIDRVWDHGVAELVGDLREWLRREVAAAGVFVPWRFELAFGLTRHREFKDDASTQEPVELVGGLKLRGSIDLVERAPDGRVRVTDYKTGRVRVTKGDLIKGGTSLQPVLYALATEQLLPGAEIVGARLSYCTTRGGFADREVPFDDAARAAAEQFVS